MRLYDPSKFKVELLEEKVVANHKELKTIENYWIVKLDTVRNGYNTRYAHRLN